ncbi:MAG: hypothetical protein KJ893_10905, partial [Candidatus Omnitrophica bacterium]|nr:hypothetical protein [Candidatus Omnitrophota bacterium]
VGKAEELEKLTGPLLVDSSKIRNLLGWKALFTMEEGLRETVYRLDSQITIHRLRGFSQIKKR